MCALALTPPEPKNNAYPQSLQGASPSFEAGPWRAGIENRNINKYNEKAATALISVLSANLAALYWLSRTGHCPALVRSLDFTLQHWVLYLHREGNTRAALCQFHTCPRAVK